MSGILGSTPHHLLAPGSIGRLGIRNRLIRAATSETMAGGDGFPGDEYLELHRNLAAGGAGLAITGHIFVEPDGQYEPWQAGLATDAAIPAFAKVTHAVHAHGGIIFAELSHAGSQSILPEITPFAPSLIPNAIHDRQPVEMSVADIRRVITAFGAAAARAKAIGFDGIHIHAGNGYLLSQFASPQTNLRSDEWGGSAERRGNFLMQVYRAIRDAVGPAMPVTARLGMADAAAGLTIEESLDRAAALVGAGLDAIEPTYNVMTSYRENIVPYAGNTLPHALRDLLVHQLFVPPAAEAYYRPFARRIRARMQTKIILVGGLRDTGTMEDVIASGDADFIAMARPFIREPDLANRILAGKRGRLDCVSCNLCFQHEGIDPLRCWRTPKSRLLQHIYQQHLKHRIGG